jgi:cyanophycinase
MKIRNIFFLFIILVLLKNVAASGHLLIIGGGKRPPEVISTFVSLAGGEHARIVIIPAASASPLDVALYQRWQFEKAGAGQVAFILFNRASADADSNLSVIENATGIFFSGGDQRRLTEAMLSTRLLDKVRQRFKEGAVVGGTSAGAAVMSEIMITGTELRNPDSTHTFASIQKGNIETTAGFGFIKDAIIDQHFIQRKRHNRLISLVLEHPDLVGIGIDEETAILVFPDHTCKVIGRRTVMIYDPTGIKDITVDSSDNFAFSNMRVHVLKAGQRFDLKTKNVLR